MRIIGHLDMDAFFASVEERDNPRLAGRPIVIGSDPLEGKGRGVVSTANYKARAYGIRSALPITKAWQFSEAARKRGLPPAVFMEPNGRKYGEVSRRIMEILREHAVQVEEASVDEAYFDISGDYEKARTTAELIKKEIKGKEHLTASIGIGPNRLIAKIASDFKKPDGLTVIKEEDAERFLEPMNIRVIPGIGPKTEEKLKKLGVHTIKDAKKFSIEELEDLMGKWGHDLYERLRGRASAELHTERDLKSISEQSTFHEDVAASERKILEAALANIAKEVYRRFLKEVATGAHFNSFRAVAITVRFADFSTTTRTVTLKEPVTATDAKGHDTLQFQVLRLFMPFLDRRENPDRKAFRLLGVRVERLAESKGEQARPTNALW